MPGLNYIIDSMGVTRTQLTQIEQGGLLGISKTLLKLKLMSHADNQKLNARFDNLIYKMIV